MNRTRLVAALLALLTPFAARAQAPARPFLWKIEGAKPSYIFGTIHLAGPRETALSPSVASAVDAADALYCEVPMDMASQMKAATAAISGGKPLREVLPADLYSRADAELKRINPALDLKPFANMQIWALAMTLTLIEEQLQHAGSQPLDAVLYSRAQAAGKEVGGIETIDEQLGIFDAFTSADQITMLRATLDDMDRARRESRAPIDELRTAYLTGDLTAIETTMNEWMESVGPDLKTRFLDILLVQRNRRMAQRIAAKLKDGPGKSYFIAVGAAHLDGDDGLLRLLGKAGLKISRPE